MKKQLSRIGKFTFAALVLGCTLCALPAICFGVDTDGKPKDLGDNPGTGGPDPKVPSATFDPAPVYVCAKCEEGVLVSVELKNASWSDVSFATTNPQKATAAKHGGSQVKIIGVEPTEVEGIELQASMDGNVIGSVRVVVVKVELDALVYGESSRKIKDIHEFEDPANVVASGYVKLEARVRPESISNSLYYEWAARAGTLAAPTAGMGNQFMRVKWDAPSAHMYDSKVTLTIREQADKPPLCKKEAPLRSIRPYVVRVRFVNDRWNEEQDIHDGRDPEYDATIDNGIFPVCYVMGKGIQVEVDLAGHEDTDKTNDLTKKTKIMVEAAANCQGIPIPFRGSAIDKGTESWKTPDYSVVSLEARENLLDYVAEWNIFQMLWTFKVKDSDGQWVVSYSVGGSFSQRTNHWRQEGDDRYGFYQIYDVRRCPEEDFTMKHLDFSCSAAWGQGTKTAVANALGPVATGKKLFGYDNTWTGSDAWRVVDLNQKADCGTLGWLMHNGLELLGIGGSQARYVYACNKDWSHLWADEGGKNEQHPTIPGIDLIMLFGGPNSENWYEGCCYYDGKWWRGGMGDSRDSAKKVLYSVCNPNISGVNNAHQAWENDKHTAVPYPAD